MIDSSSREMLTSLMARLKSLTLDLDFAQIVFGQLGSVGDVAGVTHSVVILTFIIGLKVIITILITPSAKLILLESINK